MNYEVAPQRNEAVDSATPVPANVTAKPVSKSNKGKPRGGKHSGGKSQPPNTKKKVDDPTSSKSQAHGFTEGQSVLLNYGLSVSGRRERILSPFKSDKFFHFVSQSWQQLVEIKPSLTSRFSYAEFRHCSALQLYQRLESCKFDALGIKPSAPTRIPLPRNTRVFQPLWSVLSNIGIVEDDELRATYIPDGILPETDDLSSPQDVENLLTCTLYDWSSSWKDVLAARSKRPSLSDRLGYESDEDTNEYPTQSDLIKKISDLRKKINRSSSSSNGKEGETSSSEDRKELEKLMVSAKSAKKKMIKPKFDVSYEIKDYKIVDEPINAQPGAYGQRLRWDPQLWLSYEQFVEEISGIAMFSLSMPVETSGTYAWVLPVETTDNDSDGVFSKMPKASVPPATWILALLLQSSTLSKSRRSTFYVETDTLNNVFGLRARYIRAAIKKPSPVEQYNTY